MSLNFICLYQRSHPKIDNLSQVENHHTQIILINHSINHVCHLFKLMHFLWVYKCIIPHILRGASNSKRIGYDINTSRDAKQSPRISCSLRFTNLPGLAVLTSSNFSIILSTSKSVGV